MKSELVFHEKFVNEDGSIVEMKLWRVEKTTAYPLGVRYSLYHVKHDKVLVGYDNHFPKGPHRHYGEKEEDYEFIDIQTLLSDFRKDLGRITS